jgi:thiol-disulfide isomerase/thioredoxin
LSPFHEFIRRRWDPESVRHLRESDPQALAADAEQVYDRAIKEFGDDIWWRDPKGVGREETIASVARMKRNDLRIDVGTNAPEILGRDIDNQPMKLSEFRGKVVLLCFWGSWCGPCMELVPQERSLVQHLTGKPFVLLGVNSDEDLPRAGQACQKAKITWRSWWDGIPSGSIATAWGVRGWPTLYLIDPKGVIRGKFTSGKKLDEAVEALLKEVETMK